MRYCPTCAAPIGLETAKLCHKCGAYIFAPEFATPVEGLVEGNRVYVPFPKKWIVTYGICFDENHDVEKYRQMSYPEACDTLISELKAVLTPVLHQVQQLEDQRDGECLSVRFSFMIFGPDAFPKIPSVPPFHVMEVLPFNKVYDEEENE